MARTRPFKVRFHNGGADAPISRPGCRGSTTPLRSTAGTRWLATVDQAHALGRTVNRADGRAELLHRDPSTGEEVLIQVYEPYEDAVLQLVEGAGGR
jgi:hypothetical protein